MGKGRPFPDAINEDEIDQAELVDHLTPARNAQSLQKAGHETWTCAWSPDGQYFAWSCGSRLVKLLPWNRTKHQLVHDDRDCVTIDAGYLIWSVAFGSSTAETRPHSMNLNWYRYKKFNDLTLATGLENGRIRTWNVRTGQLILELLDHQDVIRDLKFAPDGSLRLVSGSRDGKLKVWDMDDDGNMMKTLQSGMKWVYACAWSPDAKTLCSVGDGRSVVLWDMDSYQKRARLDGHNHQVCSCDFSPDGALLVTASYDTQVIVWDPASLNRLATLSHMHPPPSPIFAGGANGAYVRGVSFSHDGHHIATVADDAYVRFWNFSYPGCPEQVAPLQNGLCCSFSPDGAVLAVGSRDGTVSMLLSPMRVSSLQHLCRMAIRRLLPSTKVDQLQMPVRMKKFLNYIHPLCP
ncbi:hypothetical protein CAPTEDRAFT_179895 [Capitella teleta]|uniref:SOCS box domain-containing protein n=1 Tax=Capitella teleta TaxID=283909 RepID=R7T419_CAPTE|nr:hypothetical protein CAPTEDRAFT_179895 [Capitella teleta]|eukprot:ELT87622.1 hypothetical protein CAPTEDRAFT_179895 [Capitella teleta]